MADMCAPAFSAAPPQGFEGGDASAADLDLARAGSRARRALELFVVGWIGRDAGGPRVEGAGREQQCGDSQRAHRRYESTIGASMTAMRG